MRKIVIIDDLDMNRDVFSSMLSRGGDFEVHTFADATSAIDFLKETDHADLFAIFIDRGLACNAEGRQTNGQEIVDFINGERVKQNNHKLMPFLTMTGGNVGEEEWQVDGALMCVLKPISYAQMKAFVEEFRNFHEVSTATEALIPIKRGTPNVKRQLKKTGSAPFVID